MKCMICDKQASKKGYCERHKKAYDSIVRKFDGWKQALEISWKEYLSEIIKNPSTGEWAKEVAQYLIETGGKQNVPKD